MNEAGWNFEKARSGRWSVGDFVRRLTSEWHGKALMLFLGIFLYQYVVWFDFYWLSDTVAVVGWALAATLFCSWFLPKSFWLRGAAATAAIYYATSRIVAPAPADDIPNHALGWALAALDYTVRLSPFLWFGIGAWAVYSFIAWYISTKWRLFSVMLSSIVLFCVVDSFSHFRLWEQVAFMVGCGLMMLVIFHLKHLKEKDPSGYSHLMSYPLPITVMIITIVSASLALGVLAPSIRPIIMDPYTAWKTYQGEVVPAFSSGPGFAALTPGNSASGYSRNDSNLGGAFNFDYSPVFTVDTTRRSYWRGETRTLYTGAGWEPTPFRERDGLVPLAASPEFPAAAQEVGGLDTLEITQTFTIVEGRSFPVLFAAPYAAKVEPSQVNGEAVSLDRGFWDVDSQSVIWSEREDFPYPLAYRVTSHMPVIDEQKLRSSPALDDTDGFGEYLELPESLPERVAALAAEVTAGAASPYEKAKALETYLSLTFPYTNEPDLGKRDSADFVDSFLFEIQEGYCDYFSTAMVVMARTLDMPARWVKGYVSGQSANEFIFEQYLPGEELDLDGPGTFTVRNSDAHSWAEVYFEGFGWIPFEPTSGFSLPIVEAVNEVDTALPTDLGTAETPTSEVEESGVAAGEWIAWAVGAGVVAVLLIFFAARDQWLTLLRTSGMRKSPNYNVKFLADMERLLARFRRKGLTWAEHETLREMTARWMQQHTWLRKDLESLLSTFEKAKYSGVRLSEEEYQSAEHRIRKLREGL